MAVLTMGASNVLSRVLGLIRVQVLAGWGGTSARIDTFVFAFTLPDIINHLLAGSALSIPFIPLFQRLIKEKGEDAAWRFFSNLATVGTVLFVTLIGISMVFTGEILSLAGSNINDPGNPEKLSQALRLTRIVLPQALFIFWGALLNGVQYAHKRFLLPALMPVFYNVGIILGGVLLSPFIGIDGFAWGVLAGAFVGNVVVQVAGALRVGMRFRPRFDLRDHDLRTYAVVTLPFVIGFGVTFSNDLLIRWFGSQCPDGVGALASLDFAYKITAMLSGILGQSFAAGIYPFLSQLAVDRKFAEMNTLVCNALRKVGGVVIPVSGILMVLAKEVITVLFERGQFSSTSTSTTSLALLYYLPGSFFFAGVFVVIRAFFATKDTYTPMILSTATVLASLPLFHVLNASMGAAGIALSGSALGAGAFLLLIVVWYVRHRSSVFSGLLRDILVISAVTVVGTAVCYGIKVALAPIFATIESPFRQSVSVALAAGVPSLLLIGAFLDATRIVCFKETISELLHR